MGQSAEDGVAVATEYQCTVLNWHHQWPRVLPVIHSGLNAFGMWTCLIECRSHPFSLAAGDLGSESLAASIVGAGSFSLINIICKVT